MTTEHCKEREQSKKHDHSHAIAGASEFAAMEVNPNPNLHEFFRRVKTPPFPATLPFRQGGMLDWLSPVRALGAGSSPGRDRFQSQGMNLRGSQ